MTSPASGATGMAAALAREGVQGQAALRQRIVQVLKVRGTGTTDDFREDELVAVASVNSWGAVVNAMAREGTIIEVGFEKSQRPEARHRRVIRWRLADGAI